MFFFSLQVQHRTQYANCSLTRDLQQSNIISHDSYLIPLFTHHETLLALAPATHWVFIFKVSTCCYICSTQLHKYILCLQNITSNLTASNTGLFIYSFSTFSITLLTTNPQQAVCHHPFWFNTPCSWCCLWSLKDSACNFYWVYLCLLWPLIFCQFANYQSGSHSYVAKNCLIKTSLVFTGFGWGFFIVLIEITKYINCVQ